MTEGTVAAVLVCRRIITDTLVFGGDIGGKAQGQYQYLGPNGPGKVLKAELGTVNWKS